MGSVRPLLVQGNGKLSASIWHFDLPAVRTCPGRTAVCERVCYATHGHFQFASVQERLAWCWEQSKRDDFSDRMVEEIYRKGVPVVRVHVSGDFFSPGYTRKWRSIIRRSPRTTFFAYTRSYRIARIERVLRELAELPNLRLWYSADEETGVPSDLPPGVRVAWMQHRLEEPAAEVDLIFLTQPLRGRISLDLVCPHETPEGRARGVNCSNCRVCWE